MPTNLSKTSDPRSWAKWERSGAVETIFSPLDLKMALMRNHYHDPRTSEEIRAAIAVFCGGIPAVPTANERRATQWAVDDIFEAEVLLHEMDESDWGEVDHDDDDLDPWATELPY